MKEFPRASACLIALSKHTREYNVKRKCPSVSRRGSLPKLALHGFLIPGFHVTPKGTVYHNTAQAMCELVPQTHQHDVPSRRHERLFASFITARSTGEFDLMEQEYGQDSGARGLGSTMLYSAANIRMPPELAKKTEADSAGTTVLCKQSIVANDKTQLFTVYLWREREPPSSQPHCRQTCKK